MLVHFYIKYTTVFGQSIVMVVNNPGADRDREVPLQYLDDQYWHGFLNTNQFSKRELIDYHYVLKEPGNPDRTDHAPARSINLKKKIAKEINVFDDWQAVALAEKVFSRKPFVNVFGRQKIKIKEPGSKNPSHIFEVHATHFGDDKILCITGSAKKLNNWDLEKPVLLKKRKAAWSVKLNLSKENFPLEYKFGLYNTVEKKIVFFESGNNRILDNIHNNGKPNIFHHFISFNEQRWKGAGVNVQLSSLKTEQSWGIGDFTDLHLLTDWAVSAGIKLIQLLPVNDTTANHDKTDSYPYAAISAFALHPVFLNIQKLATAVSLEFPDEVIEKVQELNDLPQLDYEAIWKIKKEAIKELYEKDKLSFKDDFAFFDFFGLNRHWLVPYAVFCFLRDKFKTADYHKWQEYKIYDENLIQEFASPENDHYDEIAIHYFTQFHLHLQLLDAVEYAHKNKVALKGDLPIGVGRHSVETWMHPKLFHFDMQAGAPPDAFTTQGQNWGFPTYNWPHMQETGYAWWRQRMEHMSNYFDAVRIDHILGFFRIWSVPVSAIHGIFGRFIPVHALYSYDFEMAGINFNEDRICKPWITDQLVDELFGENALWVKENILDGNNFQEKFNTEKKTAHWFKNNPAKIEVQNALSALLANIILLKDEHNPHQYHFRFGMQDTSSYKNLPGNEQAVLDDLYRKYFFENQDELWLKESQPKLDAIQSSSDMLICAEDLGMVPAMVEDVLKNREILSLQVQRMPKLQTENYSNLDDAPYLSVVTPSTHDMSTLRQCWEEDRVKTPDLYNNFLKHDGTAPFYCEPWICKEIILRHLQSPAMWSIFLLQDLLAMDDTIRRQNPAEERINDPADAHHYWNYRLHITLEDLLQQEKFSVELKNMMRDAGR